MSVYAAELERLIEGENGFIPNQTNVELIREWAVEIGLIPADDTARLSNVELINLYHSRSGKPSEHDETHDWLIKVLQAVNAPGFEVSMTRKIARDEMKKEIMSGATTKQLIKETLENLAPRSLIVTSQMGSFQLDGLQHYATDEIIRIIYLGHPLMMVGAAGCGKTTIAERSAAALGLPFYITNAINEPHELTGFVDGYGKYHTTSFRQAFEFGGVWIADEIDAWDASALLVANSALANGYANFPDRNEPVYRHQYFRMVATANTFGHGADRVYVGRNELDAASLDRFAVVEVDYDLNLERNFANGRVDWLEHVWSVRKKVNEKKIRHVVSSRAIGMGSMALNNGLNWDRVNDIYLFKGMSKTDREKVIDE